MGSFYSQFKIENIKDGSMQKDILTFSLIQTLNFPLELVVYEKYGILNSQSG